MTNRGSVRPEPLQRGATTPTTERPLALLLLEAQLAIFRQTRVSGVLEAVAVAGERLGMPLYCATLLYDGGLDAWHTTALVGPDGRPADPRAVGVPEGPFPFTLPPTVAPTPLIPALQYAWGEMVCLRLGQELGVSAVMALPAPLGDPPAAVLLVLPTDLQQAALLAGLMAHAASAIARLLREAAKPLAGVMDPRAFAHQAEQEIARAERYKRTMALVVFELESYAALSRFSPAALARLRRWDFAGRLDQERPVLATVLPETDRRGGRGFVRRLRAEIKGVRVGIAVTPEDGSAFATLIGAALERAALAERVGDGAATLEQEQLWTHGVLGAGSETVRCPICRQPYSHQFHGGATNDLREDGRVAARAALEAECPAHGEQVTVPAAG